MKYTLLLVLFALLAPQQAAQSPAALMFETTRAGPFVLWERTDPGTVFALATITALDGTLQYQSIFNPKAVNRTLMDLHDGDTVMIAEVRANEARPAATHRSAPYAAVWRLRLPVVSV